MLFVVIGSLFGSNGVKSCIEYCLLCSLEVHVSELNFKEVMAMKLPLQHH